MADKPKMYQNKENKIFNNNRLVFRTGDREVINTVRDSNDIRKKINNIINSSDFIYRTKVNIVVGNEIISRKIVGIYNNNLVTIDNEYIPIDIIKDIYKEQ